MEREAIGERTRDALRHKRSQGQRVGNIAFGSRLAGDGQHLEPDPAEQAALAEIRRLRHEGATLRGIAAALNHNALRTRRGTPRRLESVARTSSSPDKDSAWIAIGIYRRCDSVAVVPQSPQPPDSW
jgi:DNA invertase Pin-like site-specific DNA recombinase